MTWNSVFVTQESSVDSAKDRIGLFTVMHDVVRRKMTSSNGAVLPISVLVLLGVCVMKGFCKGFLTKHALYPVKIPCC